MDTVSYSDLDPTDWWVRMACAAWLCRFNAHIYGEVKVGAAVHGVDDAIYAGCNVEQVFRSRDVHAEVNAITTMISQGCKRCDMILVVAERERFTPCGGCLDWIFQHGGPECLVGFQSRPQADISVYRAAELMPFYPR